MLGDLISGGLKLVGGIMDRQHAESQNELNFNRNAALAREFAQQGIRWKVEDAKAAGLHPLAALGVSTASGPSFTAGEVPSMGSTLASMGQDVGRAINATRTKDERVDAMGDTLANLQLKRASLENDLLAAQIAKLKANPNPPAPAAKSDDQSDRPGVPATLGQKDAEDRTSLVAGGRKWATDKRYSDAQEFENRYGDDGPASWYWNMRVLYNDMMKNHLSEDQFAELARAATGRRPPKWAREYFRRARNAVDPDYGRR